MNYPEGFYRVTAGREARLCYHCSACGLTYNDIPPNAQVWCCGKQKSYDGKKIPTLEYGNARSGAVDLSEPVRIGGSIIGIV
jgi:hypothetical protein